MRRWPVGMALWFVLLAAAHVVVFWALQRFFVQSGHGQLLDSFALHGNRIGQSRIQERANRVLNIISTVTLVGATGVVGFIALARRRIAVAFGAVLLVAGANLTTQFAKQLIHRPNLGIDPDLVASANTLPSGHATVAASVAVALVLVVPARMRGTTAVFGAVAAAGIGVGTLSAGWHRPSDAVAAVLVVGAWACAAALYILVTQRTHDGVRYGRAHGYAAVALTVAGVMLLAGAAAAMVLTNHVLSVPVAQLSRSRLFAAYAGGAMGIAGATALVFACVLATVHRVVPQMVPEYGHQELDTELVRYPG